MYFCFERLMTIYGSLGSSFSPLHSCTGTYGPLPLLTEDYTTSQPLSVRMTFFLSIFRQFLPDLHSYFEEEAVDMRELASAWLEGLFAKEMQIGMLMRLWGPSPSPSSSCSSLMLDTINTDVYFSIPDPLDLHPYVCLAILTTCKDALEELDQSEVRSMLLSLPPMDVDRVSASSSSLSLSLALLRLPLVSSLFERSLIRSRVRSRSLAARRGSEQSAIGVSALADEGRTAGRLLGSTILGVRALVPRAETDDELGRGERGVGGSSQPQR
jgi:hypothetical protein